MVDTIWGTAGADLLEGTEPGFVVFADGGNDAILSHDCFIEIDAGYGDDYVDIGGSAYQVLGGDGNDTIIGGPGARSSAAPASTSFTVAMAMI